MAEASGLKEVAFLDIVGGGQVVVENNTAYIGHMEGPEATSIVDVSDKKNPKIIETINCKHTGVHSHKVRVGGGLMLTNYESIAYTGEAEEGFRAGLNIYDLSDPKAPKPIHFWDTEGTGVHRFTFDGRYAYLSTTMEGYLNRIVVILDLSNPTKPEEVGRWHWPGQHTAAGEEPDIEPKRLMCHHPIRMGNMLYVSYWLAGWALVDITDMSAPKELSRMSTNPPFPCPTHTCLPIPFKLKDMDVMLVADEDVAKTHKGGPAFMWMVNVSDPIHPMIISTFQLDHISTGENQPTRTGCHQPVEQVRSTEIPVAWFKNGLRVVDVSDPHAPKEVRHFVPPVPEGADQVMSNDVYEDDDGFIYLIDRIRGLHILERT